MKSKAALALSIAGILITGSAALAVNTYTLNSSHTSTVGNASNILPPNDSATKAPVPASAPASPEATPKPTGNVRSGPAAAGAKPTPSKTASPSAARGSGGAVTDQPGSGATVATPAPVGSTVIELGDDKGGLRNGGGGGHGSDD